MHAEDLAKRVHITKHAGSDPEQSDVVNQS
jgi:hypothetical protein